MAAVVLVALVSALLMVDRTAAGRRIFQWLPVPLWCYLLPMLLCTAGALPAEDPAYRWMTSRLLPIALGLLLFGVDLPSALTAGWRMLAATAAGAAGIVLGAPLVAWILRAHLPEEAWKGVGALAATWTGGSMNLLSMRTILQPTEAIFSSLILVDAVVAYGWMILLISLAGRQESINRWLRSQPHRAATRPGPATRPRAPRLGIVYCVALAVLMAPAAAWIAGRMPTMMLVTSAQGWSVLLVTTMALGLSFVPAVRRIGASGPAAGYPCLYVVLAAMGAQASLAGLLAAPVWLLLGLGIALVHGTCMLAAGRLLRLPFGALATASQANLGGVVSTPLVGAVYQQALVPVGLLLAVGCNAVGTYLGLLAAAVSRWLGS